MDGMVDGLCVPQREHVVREGWVSKESRHWGTWRQRWLVLFRDEVTLLARALARNSAAPRARERSRSTTCGR